MKLRSLLCAAAALLCTAAVMIAAAGCKKGGGGEKGEGSQFRLAEKIEDGAILHAWCWSFDTIRESMADIASAGFSAVQTSPANAFLESPGGGMQLMGDGKWYYQYQPTDWKIGNYQLGTEDDFKAMCAEADKFGVKIIVDVVPNHTAADKDAVSRDLFEGAGGADKLYHKNAGKNIVSYNSRIECTSYSLSGLPDVNTENPQFQDYFINYLNTLIDHGADGFRYDTAKHIALPDDPQEDESLPNNFWKRVINEVKDADRIFNYGEVLQGDNDRIEAYINAIGRTTASDYGNIVRALVKGGMLSAGMLSDFLVGGSENVVTWVESHDTYTDKTSLALTDDMIVRGWAIIAANGSGTPLFFDRPFMADPANQWGSMNRVGAAGSDLYKNSTVKAVNRFRNAMAGETTKMSNPDDNSVLMIARGKKGIVLVSAKEEDTHISIPVSLPDDVYPDRTGVNGTFSVSQKKLTGTLRAGAVAVLYNEGFEIIPDPPAVSINAKSYVIGAEGERVTLHVSGTQRGTYSINGGESTGFSDGDTVTVAPRGIEQYATLKLTAIGSGGYETVMTYYFTRLRSTSAGTVIGFEKPDKWGDKIYVYIYDETQTPIVKNGVWPGAEMTPQPDGTYSYILDRDWGAALVIFSDGTNQYPAAMEPGMKLHGETLYSVPVGN